MLGRNRPYPPQLHCNSFDSSTSPIRECWHRGSSPAPGQFAGTAQAHEHHRMNKHLLLEGCDSARPLPAPNNSSHLLSQSFLQRNKLSTKPHNFCILAPCETLSVTK